MDAKLDSLSAVPDLVGKDVEVLLAALIGGAARIQRIALTQRVVWIKRYGTEKPPAWRWLQAAFARLVPLSILRPSPYLAPSEMAEREIRRSRLFAENGFATPRVLYASRGAVVFADVGQTVQARLNELRPCDPPGHDRLLVDCAAELGRLHAAGLAHGRPYPRDMFFAGERLGFMDFEEEPQGVMPLAAAQARDIWLLFLRIATAACRNETREEAYQAWSRHAPPAAIVELARMTRFLGSFLSLARLIGRVHMGSDLQRFILATSFLVAVLVNYGTD